MSEGLKGAIVSFIGVIVFILGGALVVGGLIGLLLGGGLFAIFLIVIGIVFLVINWMIAESGKKQPKKEVPPPPPP
ncbi:MAG: hypothetical protein QXO71_03575 [Candidatus Jordarchaeaceae archaeon]